MKCRCNLGPACFLFLSLACTTRSLSAQSTSSPSAVAPTATVESADNYDKMQLLTYAELEIQNPGKVKLPESRAKRIFTETIREVAKYLNPSRPPTVLGKIVLRLGEPGFQVETLVDGDRRTVIRMQTWNERDFARLVARAARHGLFSDIELDAAADIALKRVNAVTTLKELHAAQ